MIAINMCVYEKLFAAHALAFFLNRFHHSLAHCRWPKNVMRYDTFRFVCLQKIISRSIEWLLIVHVAQFFPLHDTLGSYDSVSFYEPIILMANPLKRFSIFQSKILDMSRIIGLLYFDPQKPG